MKTIFTTIIVFLFCSDVFGQWPNPENARLTNTINGFMNACGGGGFPPAVPIHSDDYVYNPSVFSGNIPQQYAQNNLTHTEIYFQKRQINKYYRLLEEAQNAEIKELKKSKQLTTQEVDRLFRRNSNY